MQRNYNTHTRHKKKYFPEENRINVCADASLTIFATEASVEAIAVDLLADLSCGAVVKVHLIRALRIFLVQHLFLHSVFLPLVFALNPLDLYYNCYCIMSHTREGPCEYITS